MIKLTGREASILAYYAEYINQDEEDMNKQLGKEAQMILQKMREIGKGRDIEKDKYGVAAQAIWNWANKKTE